MHIRNELETDPAHSAEADGRRAAANDTSQRCALCGEPTTKGDVCPACAAKADL